MKRVPGLLAAAIVAFGIGQAIAGTPPAAPVQAAAPPGAQALPEGPGRDTTLRACTACHALDVVVAKHAPMAEWFAIVQDMRGRGALVTDEEIVEIATYLGKALPPQGEGPPGAP